MQNWPIAVLEHFGLLNRVQAEHIANEIKTTIGSESYVETYDIVKNIIDKGEFRTKALLPEIEAKVNQLVVDIKTLSTKNLEAEIQDLEKQLGTLDKRWEDRIKQLENKFKESTKKPIAQPLKSM